MENFELESLKEVVKTNSPEVVKNFEEKFKEIRVEGKRKSLKDSATNYTETPPQLTTLKPSRHRLKQCTWVKNLRTGKDSIIQGLVPHPKMVGKDPILNPRIADRELFPSLGIMISEPIGIG